MLEAEYTFSYPSPGFPQTGRATALLSAPNEIAYIPEWQWKYPSEPESAYRDLSHQTDSPVCVSNAEPVDPITKPLEIILKWSCQWLEGAGVSSEKKIVDRLYEMCPMGTKEDNGVDFLFYNQSLGPGTAGLLKYGMGSCNEWCYYLSNLIRSQGVQIDVMLMEFQGHDPLGLGENIFHGVLTTSYGTNTNVDDLPTKPDSYLFDNGVYLCDDNYRRYNTPYTSISNLKQCLLSAFETGHPLANAHWWSFGFHFVVIFVAGDSYLYDPSFIEGPSPQPVNLTFIPTDGLVMFDTQELRTKYLDTLITYYIGDIKVDGFSNSFKTAVRSYQICQINRENELKIVWQINTTWQ